MTRRFGPPDPLLLSHPPFGMDIDTLQVPWGGGGGGISARKNEYPDRQGAIWQVNINGK